MLWGRSALRDSQSRGVYLELTANGNVAAERDDDVLCWISISDHHVISHPKDVTDVRYFYLSPWRVALFA